MNNRISTALVFTSILAVALTGCSSSASIAGTWSASDGTQAKVIGDNGDCSGMYYNGGRVLDIGGAETCTLSSSQTNGYYSLVVRQAPNQMTYQAKIDGGTMTLSVGGATVVTLTKQ